MEENKTVVTLKGRYELDKENDYLVRYERDTVIEELKAARAQGDLSENADYDAARDHQARVEARIRDLEVMLANLEIVATDSVSDYEETLKKELQELENPEAALAELPSEEAKARYQTYINYRLPKVKKMLAEVADLASTSKSKGKKIVKLGSVVTIETLDEHQIETYTIVGTVEADPLNGKLSNETPLAKALLDHKVNDTVTVNVQHLYKVQIKSIK